MRPIVSRTVPDAVSLALRVSSRIACPRLGILGIVLAAAALSPAPVRAAVESFGVRQTPLADAPEYGEIVYTNPDQTVAPPTGAVVVSTREGVEVRAAASPDAASPGIYRAAGVVQGLAALNARAYLFQGDRGFTVLDVATPSTPTAVTAVQTPTPVHFGAVLTDGSVAAASDSFVYLYRWNAGDAYDLSQTITYSDGRLVRRVRAHGDSLLVVAARPGVLARLYLSVYRFPVGAASATLLHEWISNGKGANDAVWSPPNAYVADGNAGIYEINTATGVFGPTTVAGGSRFVRALAVHPSKVFAAEETGFIEVFGRSALGDTLTFQAQSATQLEPVAVAAVATDSIAVASTRDVITNIEPDETGRSQLERVAQDASAPAAPGPGTIGRSRRVVVSGGLAYVADYTGGLRIYRAGSADTSLVGVLPAVGGGRAVDLALDAADSLVYLASGGAGLEVVDVSDPASPFRVGSLTLPGLTSAVTVINANTVAVGRRGGAAGVTFVDVTTPSAPFARGHVDDPFVLDPRALAARDTVLFVADLQLGLLSIRFGDLDAPATLGNPSTSGARDLDLQGTILLVGSRSLGLQVVDVFNPASPILRSQVTLPPIYGVARNGATAVVALGDQGVALVNVASPTAAFLRGVVPAAGFPRDAAWTGDTLLVAGGTSVDRFRLSASVPSGGGLDVSLDTSARVLLAWGTVATQAGQVGWNVVREAGAPATGTQTPAGTRVNAQLLDLSTTNAIDAGAVSGALNRYRLEAVFGDGRVLTVAEGSITVPSTARVGLPYPNPFRASNGGVVVPYRTVQAGGSVTLRVADVRGRVIREMKKAGPPQPGFDSMTWDGRNNVGRRVPGGVYYLYVSGLGIDEARAVVFLP